MIKKIRNIILSVLAAIIFLTGTGVTVMDYCCSSCGGQTLFITTHTCHCGAVLADVHEQAYCHTADDNKNGISCSNGCASSRLSIDIDSSYVKPNIVIPFIWLSEFSSPLSQTQNDSIIGSFEYENFINPPPLIPRAYLSLIQILII